jgi:hypothetical protein
MQEHFDNNLRTLVMYDMGRLGGDQRRMILAPFSILNTTGGTFLSTNNSVLGTAKQALAWTELNGAGHPQNLFCGEYYIDGIRVMGEHEMGDYNGHPNDITGCHAFSRF